MITFDKETQIIQNEIIARGYESLRISVFKDKNTNRKDWQTRIEYCPDKQRYIVYSLADRASLMGNIREFQSFKKAEEEFFKVLDLTVKYNNLKVMNNESPEYNSPLWN